ncbi:hypothetical protein IFM89_001661 [Coptis chinensis]|uniref:Protein kinase domain-containing protein n=1 Tax=Coptis chinensis TaxID=261450 RepID=A0A835HI56_9MAGN|nr:hypothetical protein IFM89_001661 [Coptis chinensis]
MKIALRLILQLFFFSTLLRTIYSASTTNSTYYYNQCAPSTCGSSTMKFPFGEKPLCSSGYIRTTCENNSVYLIDEENTHIKYKLLQNLTNEVYTNRSIRLVDNSLFGCGTLPPFIGSPRQNSGYEAETRSLLGAFQYSSTYRIGTFFNCTREPDKDTLARMTRSPCLECGETSNLCYFYDYYIGEFYDGYVGNVDGCIPFRVAIPVNIAANLSVVRNLRRVLQEGFQVQWDEKCNSCMENDVGRCGYVNQEKKTSREEYCFCRDGVHKDNCNGNIIDLDGTAGKDILNKKKIGLIVGIGMTGAAFMFSCALYISYKRRQKKHSPFRSTYDQVLRRYLDGDNGTTPASIQTFLHNYSLERPTRFSYKQLKKYTNNFAQKIGQGGFGSVFKGQLPNGFTIAVKILDETTNQIETQFLNEVLTIGCIHHNHLVRLMGYCFDRSRIALIYEYLVNGSLDKYILQKRHMNKGQSKNTSTPQDVTEIMNLMWTQLLDIAIGTAKGLAYLHEECRNRILHCDIKPHNILLDDKFQPKVSDFGLAMLLNKENSYISVTHGTGTPGYAPPEMWYAKFGPVTDKSDVYSFGMVVLEMAGKRRNFEVDVSKTSEMYFPEWVFSHHVQNAYGDGGGSKWHECQGKEEEEIAMRLELVGLWCIQFEPSKRPSMRKVVDMLEGTMAVEIPSAPFDGNMSTYGYGSDVTIAPELDTLSSFKNAESNGSFAD